MFRVFGVEQGNILKSLIFSCVEIFLSTVSLLNYFCHVVFILILSCVYLIFSCFEHIKTLMTRKMFLCRWKYVTWPSCLDRPLLGQEMTL